MKLYDAIKEIVKLKGKNIITDSALLNYLNDYHAFEEKPSTKSVLRDLIKSGYSEKMLHLQCTGNSWNIDLKSFDHNFIEYYGYNDDIVNYVFQCLAFALDLTKDCPIVVDSEDKVYNSMSKADNKQSTRYMTFKHIQMSGNAETFMHALESIGFVILSNYNVNSPHYGELKGNFAGFDNCIVTVNENEKNDDIESIMVIFPSSSSWTIIRKEYESLKISLAKKYSLVEDGEYFDSPYKEGDGRELEALMLFKCIFYAGYKCDGGTVDLSIVADWDKQGYGMVTLKYSNIINNDIEIIAEDL